LFEHCFSLTAQRSSALGPAFLNSQALPRSKRTPKAQRYRLLRLEWHWQQ
jgi:hypothetical protein